MGFVGTVIATLPRIPRSLKQSREVITSPAVRIVTKAMWIKPMDARKTDSVLFGSGQRSHEERTRFYFDADNIRDEHGQIEHEIRTKLA